MIVKKRWTKFFGEQHCVTVTVFLGVGLTLLFSTVYYVPQGSHLGRVLATGERGRTHRTKLAEKLRKVTWEVGNKAFCCLTWQKQNVQQQEGDGFIIFFLRFRCGATTTTTDRKRFLGHLFLWHLTCSQLNSGYWIQLESSSVVGLTLIATVRQSFLMGTRDDDIVIIAVGSVEIAHHGLDDYLGMSVCL